MMLARLWQAVTNTKLLSEEEVEVQGEEKEQRNAASAAVTLSASQKPLTEWLRECEGKHIVDKTFPRPLSELMKLLYSDDSFYSNFQKDRGTTELDIGAWEVEPETGAKARDLTYSVALNNYIFVGPKSCQVKETQVLKEMLEVQMFSVDTEADNSGVPYADSFSVLTHNCLLEVGPESSRLIAKAEIKFKRELWGFLKDKIEAILLADITNYYESLTSSLETFRDSKPQQ